MPRRSAAPAVACAALLLALAGCSTGTSSTADSAPAPLSSAPTSTAGTPPSSTAPTSASPAAVEVTVRVQDGAVTPEPADVDVPLGSTVRITVTSDVADEVHLHGYDVEEEVAAGGTATIELTADTAGTFDLETHESGLLLLRLVVS